MAAPSGSQVSDDAVTTMLMHHLNSFQANDLVALMSDYTEESILVTADATYEGRSEIRTFFAAMIPQFPKQHTSFDLDKLTVAQDLGFIVWHASTPSLSVPFGSDTFLVRDGKIHRQTFVGKLTPVATVR